MPPWLMALLTKNQSAGMIDSLNTLVGVSPSFQESILSGDRVGNTSADSAGHPVISLGPRVTFHYGEALPRGYQGSKYKSVDPAVKFGDAVIQHEFGHVAANTPMLAEQLEKINPQAYQSEELADQFQNAFQFLRSRTTNTSQLDPTTREVVDVLLRHPLFQNHPLNQVSRKP